jgi:hypothetical protein
MFGGTAKKSYFTGIAKKAEYIATAMSLPSLLILAAKSTDGI